MQSNEPKSAKRRVPAALRRRALVSCDRCKRRRRRCVRPGESNGPCRACLESGSPCVSSLPRKTRVYGSIEKLNLRYRTLDTLVQGLFPGEDIEDLQVIYRLAAERQISLPDLNDQPTIQEAPEDHVSTIEQSPALSDAQFNLPWPYEIDQTVQGTVVNLQEETCIPAPHGVAHYVGPASSFDFATAIRILVSKVNNTTSGHIGGVRRSKLLADFANLKISIAMEPRIQEHPASTIRDESIEDGTSETLSAHTTPARGDNFQPSTISRNSNSPFRKWLQSLLPVRRDSDRLIDAFFTRVHPNYLLFHRGTFQTRYESIWHRTISSSHEVESGWLCCLFMVLVFGAQALEVQGFDEATSLQRRFLRFVRQRFQHLALTASLANVQALLLLQLYEHNAGERNTSWVLLGQAARMAIALGMHRKGTCHYFDTIERNTRRMVWFTLYSFEQFASLMLGRPSTIKALEVNIELPDETIIDGHDLPPGYLSSATALMDLMSKVRQFATAASPNCFDSAVLSSLFESATSLSKELKLWKDKLPEHLLPEWHFISTKHRRIVLLLHITYYHISSVLTRPYLLCRTNSEIELKFVSSNSAMSATHDGIERLSNECLASSSLIANLLQQLEQHSVLEGVIWTDFFYLYHSVLVLSLAFLPQRNSQMSQTSTQSSRYQSDVENLVRLCQNHALGPTYQILSQVAIQFAHIVELVGESGELGTNDDVRDDVAGLSAVSEEPSGHSNGAPSMNTDDFWVPFVEPIFGMQNYGNSDMPWDFFNIGGVENASSTFWPSTQSWAI